MRLSSLKDGKITMIINKVNKSSKSINVYSSHKDMMWLQMTWIVAQVVLYALLFCTVAPINCNCIVKGNSTILYTISIFVFRRNKIKLFMT